ncbi:MAG TPA: 3-hydroxyacyl-ACP dehydratase FabZ [Gemmatimonadaceae bacterium]|nr:3-hydroxyacyl-ACP dehydratase FabZ [Gemmatimonadaceae bacterium]
MLGIDEVMRILPHRYPFLFVDAVTEFVPGTRLVAVKNVTANEPFFAGTPDGPMLMPGLLILEAMAQAGGLLFMAGQADPSQRVVYFASIDGVRWHGYARPGDQLRIEVLVTHARGRMRKVRAEAFVGDMLACEAELAAVVMDR